MKVKQGKEFFFYVGSGNLDGTIDYDDYQLGAVETEEEALEEAKADTEEHSETTYVFRCIPIYRVRSGKIRVDKLKTD